MQKVYYKWIDLMKVICALLVIGVHTGPLLSISQEANFVVTQIFGRIAVPFFFVSSSYFFFRKLDDSKPLTNSKNRNYLKHYVKRIAKLYLVWSLVYFVLVAAGWMKNGFNMIAVLRYIRDFFFTGSYYHLWFLPAMIVAVVVIYSLLIKLSAKKVWRISLLLYVIGMMINVYEDLLFDIPLISTIVHVYLKIFVTSRNGIFFGMIYTMMGYCLAKKQPTCSNQKLVAMTAFSFLLLVIEAVLILKAGYMDDLTAMYLALIPLEYFVFALLLRYPSYHNEKILREISTLMYVSHILFCTLLLRISFFSTNSIIYFLMVSFCTILFSYGMIRLSDKVSWIRRFY